MSEIISGNSGNILNGIDSFVNFNPSSSSDAKYNIYDRSNTDIFNDTARASIYYDSSKKYRQTIKINGGRPLHNGALEFKDLRAGATLALAALSVKGESIVKGASILERGYEDFIGKVKRLGGVISRV